MYVTFSVERHLFKIAVKLDTNVKMSGQKHSEHETDEISLGKAMEDVSQHAYALTETLKKNEQTLSTLQAALSDVEQKDEIAGEELRCKVREILLLGGEMEQLERQIKAQHDRCAFISKESAGLQILISEEEESARLAMEGFNTYRKKMEDHRVAVLHALSQTEVHKELEGRRALVRMLREKKEELKEGLKNPNENTMLVAKREVDALKEAIAEREELLRKKIETQAQIKQDIGIQARRYEAIVKRLHCQLSRAQAVHRQMSEDIYHMENQLAELKQNQESTQDAAANHQNSDYPV